MAARDYIKIDRTTTTAVHAQLLTSYIASVRSAYEMGKRISGIADHNNDGTNYADVETLFGLPTGTGAAVLALVTAAVKDSDAKALTERIG
jgi:hypothetical protein